MAGLFSRVKQWIQDEKLLFSVLNAEFDNIITNSELSKMKGHSDTAEQMRLVEDPGAAGAESFGSNISGSDEVERLRYVINRMIGGTYWYDAPAASLTSLAASVTASNLVPQNRIVSGKVDLNRQPTFLLAAGSSKSVSLLATATPLSYVIEGTSGTVSADVALGTIGVAPAVGAPGVTANGAVGAYDTEITIAGSGAEFSARVGQYCAFKIDTAGNAEYFFGFLQSATKITRCMRGVFFDSAGLAPASVSHLTGVAVIVLGLNWVFLKNDGSLDSCTTNPTFSGTAPSAPASGDYWFDLSLSKWKKYNGATWDEVTSLLLGLAVCDATNCIRSRSFDFYKSVTDLLHVRLEKESASVIRTSSPGYGINVYGVNYQTTAGQLRWDMATDLDEGIEAISTRYYLYVTDTGAPKVSVAKPLDRRHDLLGWYHPSKPWRSVGYSDNDGSSNLGNPECYALIQKEQLAINPYAISASCGATNCQGTSPADIANLSVTITATGRPVRLELVADGTTNESYLRSHPISNIADDERAVIVYFKEGSTTLAVLRAGHTMSAADDTSSHSFAPSAFSHTFLPAAGSHTYKVQGAAHNGSYEVDWNYVKLVAHEVL